MAADLLRGLLEVVVAATTLVAGTVEEDPMHDLAAVLEVGQAEVGTATGNAEVKTWVEMTAGKERAVVGAATRGAEAGCRVSRFHRPPARSSRKERPGEGLKWESGRLFRLTSEWGVS
jgi:hypothetical protein